MEENIKGELYLVATPIGNLEDITFRAMNTLKKVDIIAAEDTRHTIKLLNYYKIKKPLISYYKENEKIKSNEIIGEILGGKNVAIVSDAGTPGISDPGEEIVKKAIENNINIIPIPGACALISSVICSGFSTREFTFIGFLPITAKERKEKLLEVKNEKRTIIIYEAPHRILKTLKCIKEILGNRNIVLARELTKIHEEKIRGTIEEITAKEIQIKGEFVITIEGNKKEKEDNLSKLSLEEHYEIYKNSGMEKKDIIKQIAKDRNVSKNDIYQYFLKV